MASPRIVIAPHSSDFASDAVRRGGGIPVSPGDGADALVWLSGFDASGLKEILSSCPTIRWVQLPVAGIENFGSKGLFSERQVWTCAKGAYAEPVAEHALALALAGLRQLPTRLRADSWGERFGLSLFDAPVTILGGGGIASSLISLLLPFRSDITVVRRQSGTLEGARSVLGTDRLEEAISGSLVVFVALALTPSTEGIIDAQRLAAMEETAWLVNVGRGRHVVTDDLVAALKRRQIGGAALDVTDPEPLPAGHPLWRLPNAIVTPHTADTPEMVERLLGERIADNTRRFSRGETLEGLVDIEAGY